MILAIVWKEWREQRSIALAIMAFGALALVLTGQFAEPVTGQSILDAAGPRELMAPALAYLAGIVCGAILFADEKEVGTLEFLDSMPSRRRSLWLGKVVFGHRIDVFAMRAFCRLGVCPRMRASPGFDPGIRDRDGTDWLAGVRVGGIRRRVVAIDAGRRILRGSFVVRGGNCAGNSVGSSLRPAFVRT